MDSVTQELDWEFLRGLIAPWLETKCNDVDDTLILRELRSQAYEKGFTQSQFSQSVTRLRIRRDEDKQRKKAEPPAPEQPKETEEVRQTAKLQEFPVDTRRSPQVAPRGDLTAAGNKLRSKNTPSIVDGDFK